MSEQITNPAQIEAVNTINRLSEFYGVPSPQIIFTDLPKCPSDVNSFIQQIQAQYGISIPPEELSNRLQCDKTLLGLHCNDCSNGSPLIFLNQNPSKETSIHEEGHHIAEMKGIQNTEEFAKMFTRMHMQEESIWKREFLGVTTGEWIVAISTPLLTGIILYLVLRRKE